MADIVITDITNATDADKGTGIFDVLVEAVERRIRAQFDAGRLTGADFANVYLGALQAVLGQSIQYVLQEQQAGLQADETFSRTNNERALAEAQIEKQWGFDVTRDANGNLILGADIATGLIDSQVIQTNEQIQLAIGQTSKAYAEVSLLGQKQETELAQTSDASGGIALAQQNLYRAQTLGFEGKHKNELIKQMLDTWAVMYSIQDGIIPDDFGVPAFLEEASPTIPLIDMPALDILITESDALFD